MEDRRVGASVHRIPPTMTADRKEHMCKSAKDEQWYLIIYTHRPSGHEQRALVQGSSQWHAIERLLAVASDVRDDAIHVIEQPTPGQMGELSITIGKRFVVI